MATAHPIQRAGRWPVCTCWVGDWGPACEFFDPFWRRRVGRQQCCHVTRVKEERNSETHNTTHHNAPHDNTPLTTQLTTHHKMASSAPATHFNASKRESTSLLYFKWHAVYAGNPRQLYRKTFSPDNEKAKIHALWYSGTERAY